MILLTGFEPFGGESTNPSWAAAEEAAARLRGEGLEVQAVELPCVFGDAARVLEAALEQYRPELVICAGQAGGRSRVSLERVAINCDDARIPDNAGNAPVDPAGGHRRTGRILQHASGESGARGPPRGGDPR